MVMEIKYFGRDGSYDGRDVFEDNALTVEAARIAEAVFADGGHVEVWRDDVRPYDTPATSMEELADQFATIKAGVPTETPAFRTIAGALAAGYRRPSGEDRDVSGGSDFGYDYESPSGEQTVTVSLTEEKNKIGGVGSFMAMFPPQWYTRCEHCGLEVEGTNPHATGPCPRCNRTLRVRHNGQAAVNS